MNEYYEMLKPIPNFLYKYLELDIVRRLKGISLFCGMDYASPYAYQFKEYISRYDHSLNVALLTWKLTNNKCATLAGLFHDISTPVFSHVVDYMNGDYVDQESTEEKTSEIMLNSLELKKCLLIDNIGIESIIDFKEYSVVDLDRPMMCADRLDNIILTSYNWIHSLDCNLVSKILDSIYLEKNENDKYEIAFNDITIALYIKSLNDEMNKYTHSNVDNYMMDLASKIVKFTIESGIVSYNDLFTLTEKKYISIIENNLFIPELNDLWNEFKNIKEFPFKEMPPIKDKIVSPLVKKRRI